MALSLIPTMESFTPNMMPHRPAFRLLAALAFAYPLVNHASAPAGLVEFQILPSRTDPAIRTFDQPHVIRLNRDIVVERKPGLPAPRGQLLLFLPGTVPPDAAAASKAKGSAAPKKASAGRGGAIAFCELAAHLGYHVIFLQYPNDKSAAAAARDADIAEFERFRWRSSRAARRATSP